MITIILNRYGKKESMEISPCYEKVLLTLWKLGLDRDPEKYTLKELGATFTYETPEEHQMVRIINANDTLMDALLALMRMREQPELILESIEPAIQKGRCSSIDHLDALIDYAIDSNCSYEAEFLFPISGTVVRQNGKAMDADPLLLYYLDGQINHAMERVQRQSMQNLALHFWEIGDLYEKILDVKWQIRKRGKSLIGSVKFLLADELTSDEYQGIAETIELINSHELAFRLNQWSTLTGEGLLYIRLCDESGSYAVLTVDEAGSEDGEVCLCPDCQEKLRRGEPLIPKGADPKPGDLCWDDIIRCAGDAARTLAELQEACDEEDDE